MKQILSALLSGTIFGAGLAIAGMTNPKIVQDFLDPFGTWNPALAFVMGGGLLVTIIGFWLLRRRMRPLFAKRFQWPSFTAIDAPLLSGAALFGVGWGLSGYCPGPALASLSSGNFGLGLFVSAMLAGIVLTRHLLPKSESALDKTVITSTNTHLAESAIR